jgi:hypothetical protein
MNSAREMDRKIILLRQSTPALDAQSARRKRNARIMGERNYCALT